MITFAEVERLATLLVGQVPSMSAVVTAWALIEVGGNAANPGSLLRHHDDRRAGLNPVHVRQHRANRKACCSRMLTFLPTSGRYRKD